MIIKDSFDEVYNALLLELYYKGIKSTTRKGQVITELFDQSFKVLDAMDCLAHCREYSKDYLIGELNFYLSGSNSIKEAAKISKFWLKCTDDGKTINSNYGKLIFHDRTTKGITQFEHALKCLKNNPQSKKAVMTVYNNENAYISNDNPCTMFLRARIDDNQHLHLSTYMRSSDVYYGLPYDVPFFVFVQYCLAKELGVKMGSYTHVASSLHKYDYKEPQIKKITENYKPTLAYNPLYIKDLFEALYQKFKRIQFMQEAWRQAEFAKCLKKHVGACIVYKGEVLYSAYGGVNGPACTVCARDNKDDKFFGDGCRSVHAEMKCILYLLTRGFNDFKNCTVYVTHGPCDACLKLCDYVGITKVFYDKPYKTDYNHWPRIKVCQINELIS